MRTGVLRAFIILSLWIVACWLSGPAFSQSNEITANPNRPTVSNPADITQYGVLEIEYGIETDRDHREICGLVKFSVLKDLELRLNNMPVVEDRTNSNYGFGDTSAGAQYRFLHQSRSVPTMAIYYGLKFPTANAALGSGKYDHDFLWLVSKDFSKLHADFNLDFRLLGRQEGRRFDQLVAPALALSYALPHNFTIATELSGTTRENSATPGSASFMTALSFALRPRLVFDSAISFRLKGEIPHTMFLAGFTYSITDLYHHAKH